MERNSEENQHTSPQNHSQLRKQIPIFLFFKQLFESRSRQFLPYLIENSIDSSSATRVLFIRSPRSLWQCCLKIWQACDNELYLDKTKWTDYVLEGWKFNRRFASGVYVGIALVRLLEVNNTLELSGLIRMPNEKKVRMRQLEAQEQYALVMRCLDKDWQLDGQLKRGELSTRSGLEFLATEIARMHQALESSPNDMGTVDHIRAKLKFNTGLFEKALNQLASTKFDTGEYWFIPELMKGAYEKCVKYFIQRFETGHIKRCHGDLKATNLWVQPETVRFLGLRKSSQRLLALDCIDFNPEFCHIDTLSDVAMLAIDIEAYLVDQFAGSIQEETDGDPAQYFLEAYLKQVGEQGTEPIWTLLEYYMTEKAIVCAIMSILYDKLPQFDRRYLDIALIHAQRLEDLLGLQD
jgi:aminoglycoside phosphotransferase family enzyme